MNILIDSWGWIELCEGTDKGARVLRLIIDPKNTSYTTALNIYEVWHQATRRFGRLKAQEIVATLNNYCSSIEIDQSLAIKASDVHLQEGLSAIDSFVYVAALVKNCHIVTGDRKDFGKFKKVILI